MVLLTHAAAPLSDPAATKWTNVPGISLSPGTSQTSTTPYIDESGSPGASSDATCLVAPATVALSDRAEHWPRKNSDAVTSVIGVIEALIVSD